ncbi:hypothetical protein BJ912DRAFT_502 [Pholiota molesta]|nr:hypothetical protein BJ912DRAFT_502 [Pholiota molesta]
MARGALVVIIYPLWLGMRHKKRSGQIWVYGFGIAAAGGLRRGVEDGSSLRVSFILSFFSLASTSSFACLCCFHGSERPVGALRWIRSVRSGSSVCNCWILQTADGFVFGCAVRHASMERSTRYDALHAADRRPGTRLLGVVLHPLCAGVLRILSGRICLLLYRFLASSTRVSYFIFILLHCVWPSQHPRIS